MTTDNVIHSNELTIRFDQMEDGTINWWILPDDRVRNSQEFSLLDLAEYDAPLCAMGIRALWQLCNDGLVNASLETANAIKYGVDQRIAIGRAAAELDLGAEERLIH